MDINKSFTEAYLKNNYVKQIQWNYREFIEHLDRGIPVCLEYHKSESSPSTFDANMAENKSLCNASRAYVNSMPKEVAEPFPKLEDLGFNGFKGKILYNRDYYNSTRRLRNIYEDSQYRYAYLKHLAEPPSTVSLFHLFSPLAFAIACALRITKVTGEVLIARKKKQLKKKKTRLELWKS